MKDPVVANQYRHTSPLAGIPIQGTKGENGLWLVTYVTGTPPTTADTFSKGCLCLDVTNGKAYINTGTSSVPSWDSLGDISAGEITLANTKILVGNASGVAAGVSMSGDATIANTGVVTVTGATGAFSVGGKISLYAIGSAAQSASGLLMGIGTTAAPALSSTPDAIFAEFRTKSTATSGDSRGIYWRHEINGVGSGGEAGRVFTKITAAATTARGMHISLDLDAAGSVSGFGAGVDAQLMLGAAAYDDDITVQNLEIYANAGATVTGRTSFLRPVIQGDGTAVADVNANAFFADFSNVVASASGLLDTDITALTGYAGLRVRCPDGVTRYIPITTGS